MQRRSNNHPSSYALFMMEVSLLCTFAKFIHSKYHHMYTMQWGLNIKQEWKSWWLKWELFHLDSRVWVITPLLVLRGGAFTRKRSCWRKYVTESQAWDVEAQLTAPAVSTACCHASLPWGPPPPPPAPQNHISKCTLSSISCLSHGVLSQPTEKQTINHLV